MTLHRIGDKKPDHVLVSPAQCRTALLLSLAYDFRNRANLLFRCRKVRLILGLSSAKHADACAVVVIVEGGGI